LRKHGLNVYGHVYTMKKRVMKTAKIFRSGNSQAVRIPKEFQLEGRDVQIERRGDVLVLRPIRRSWDALIGSLAKFSKDYMSTTRRQPRQKKREPLS
jgi:antitoxin VapB